MSRPQSYPGSQIKITAPFFLLVCSCGFQSWSILGELTPCPACGKIMVREGGAGSDAPGQD